MPAIPIIAVAASAYGAISSAKASKKANDIAQQQANKPAPTVDINALDQQARDLSAKNAAEGQAMLEKYNPGITALRTGSTSALANSLNANPQTTELASRIAAQAGTTPNATYDSPLTRLAAQQATADLSLGGRIPLDVQNAATRHALSTTGGVTGGLGLGRDLVARDLGLTSLDLAQRRLTNASTIGGQEANLNAGQANLSLQEQLAGTNNLFNSANFLNSVDNGNFSRALSASQLSQNIAAPQTGLDPGTVANLAVGNSNAGAAQAQQAAALGVSAANQKAALGAQIAGTGLGFVQNYLNSPKPAAAPTYTAPPPSQIPYYGYGVTAPAALPPSYAY